MPKQKSESSSTDAVPSAEQQRDGTSSEMLAGVSTEVIEILLTQTMTKLLPELMVKVVETFEACLGKLVQTFEDKMKDKFDYLSGELYDVNTRIDRLQQQLSHCQQQKENAIDEAAALKNQLSGQMSAMEQQLDEQEQYVKRDNLMFHGIEETEGEDTSMKIIDICQKFFPTVKIQPSDISNSHRLPTRAVGKTKPIIVRFSRRVIRQQIFQNKRQLKNSKKWLLNI